MALHARCAAKQKENADEGCGRDKTRRAPQIYFKRNKNIHQQGTHRNDDLNNKNSCLFRSCLHFSLFLSVSSICTTQEAQNRKEFRARTFNHFDQSNVNLLKISKFVRRTNNIGNLNGIARRTKFQNLYFFECRNSFASIFDMRRAQRTHTIRRHEQRTRTTNTLNYLSPFDWLSHRKENRNETLPPNNTKENRTKRSHSPCIRCAQPSDRDREMPSF